MKSQFKKPPIALVVAAMIASPMAFASGDGQDGPDGGGNHHDPVQIKKDIDVTQHVTTSGQVQVGGLIGIDSSSMAVVNDAQVNGNNNVTNDQVTNSATVGANVLTNASGNVGVNVTAGDNNQQANAAALSSSDASFVFGSSDAELFATQAVGGNSTTNMANTNTASLAGNSLQNASGNIGVNISAGDSNQQKNDLAASVAVARMATATVKVNQLNGNNTTDNQVKNKDVVTTVDVALNASLAGKFAGTADMNGNQYPDMWSGPSHPGGVSTGHFDLDTSTQGGIDNPVHAALDSNGNPTGPVSNGGSLNFNEEGDVALHGLVTGSIPVVYHVSQLTTNTASLADNVLVGASGNIGVNVAAGTNNQQYNGLAISATQAGTAVGGGSSGEPQVH